MVRIVFILILLYSLSVKLEAQNPEQDGWDMHVKLEKPQAKLNEAEGWLYDPQNDTWINKKNEIVNLDNFNNLKLGVGLLDGKKYLYLVKEYVTSYFRHDADNPRHTWTDDIKSNFVYLLDLEQFKKEVQQINDIYNVLHLDILEKQGLRADKSRMLPLNTSQSPYYESLRKAEISVYMEKLQNAVDLYYPYQIEELQGVLKEKRVPFRDRHKLIIKFDADENREKIRFFIFEANTYYLKGRYIIPYGNFFMAKDQDNTIEITEDMMYIMWSEETFDYFFFEADYQKFMNFIKAPLDF